MVLSVGVVQSEYTIQNYSLLTLCCMLGLVSSDRWELEGGRGGMPLPKMADIAITMEGEGGCVL